MCLHCVCVRRVSFTWAFLDTEGSIGVLCPGIVFQLKGGGVVDKWLRALGHTCPAVIEVGAGLYTHGDKVFSLPSTFIQGQVVCEFWNHVG